MSHRKSGLRPIVLASLFAFCAAPAFAERPMAVDDAGTLERGGAKLEFGWSRDDAVRGYEGAAGFGPIDNVEVELTLDNLLSKLQHAFVVDKGNFSIAQVMITSMVVVVMYIN